MFTMLSVQTDQDLSKVDEQTSGLACQFRWEWYAWGNPSYHIVELKICVIREICVTFHSARQLCVRNELMMAVRTVMMNWIMVFQVFRSLRNFIKSSLVVVSGLYRTRISTNYHYYSLVIYVNFRTFVLKRRSELPSCLRTHWRWLVIIAAGTATVRRSPSAWHALRSGAGFLQRSLQVQVPGDELTILLPNPRPVTLCC